MLKDRVKLTSKLSNGDQVRIKVDFDGNEVLFYKNGVLEGRILSDLSLADVELYPCVNLSQGTVVTLLNEYL